MRVNTASSVGAFKICKIHWPIRFISSTPMPRVVNAGVPVASFKEFVRYAKARPGQLNFASSGTGSTAHLVFELINADAGLKMTHVPFRGGAINEVIAGRVDVMFEPLATAIEHISSSVTGSVAQVVMPAAVAQDC